MDKEIAQTNAILYVDHAQALGGAEHSLLLLLKHLSHTEWQSYLACPAGGLAEKGTELGFPWQPVNLPRLRRSLRFPWEWYRYASKLAQIARQVGAVTLYANTVRATLYVMLAAKMAKRPFVWHMRDFWLSENEPRYHKIDWIIKSLLCRAASHIIVNSAATASHLPCLNKITVIHNGVDLARFQAVQNGLGFRQRFNIPATAPLVGTVGRLRPWKGQTRFIQMAAVVVAKQPDAHFVIVGGSPFGVKDNYLETLQQLVKAHKLTHCLHFTGHLQDVRPALAALDIFVHPGDPEPFGLVNIEAMAMSKPVVAFAHGALPEIVVHEETGLLVQPGDVAGLSQAVLTLLHSPKQRKQLGYVGQQRVKDLFTIQHTAVQVTTVLQNLLGK